MITDNIQFGDIVRVISSNNKNEIDEIFLVNYIDATKIELINSRIKKIISIENSQFENNIEVELILPTIIAGYAIQNKLIRNTYIEIHFDFDLIITGEIINTENDRIDVRIFNDLLKEEEIIYIDFRYQGLYDDLHIKRPNNNNVDDLNLNLNLNLNYDD